MADSPYRQGQCWSAAVERTNASVLARGRGARVMLPYWMLFLVPAFAAIAERSSVTSHRGSTFVWLLIWSLLTIVIGLRYQVGADWDQYEYILSQNSNLL